jgi:hypothetical protein
MMGGPYLARHHRARCGKPQNVAKRAKSRANKARLTPFIAFLVRLQPDDPPFFLPLRHEILALFRPSPSFTALRDGIFSFFCRFAGPPVSQWWRIVQAAGVENWGGGSDFGTWDSTNLRTK